MSTRYDAWSELPAPLAEALRSSLYTGDWSGWEPDVVDAFRLAFNENDWSAFDPQTATTIRAAIGQEQIAVEARTNQERFTAEARADRELAAAEADLRSKYSDYGANRRAILELAVRGNIADLDAAYRTWRSSTGHDGPALAGQEPATEKAEPSPVERFREIEAQLADDKTTSDQRRKLKWELDDLRNQHGLAIGFALQAREASKVKTDPHTVGEREAHRRDLIHNENEARRIRNAERTFSNSRGHTDQSSREPKDARNARLEREAFDSIQGRAQPNDIGEPEIAQPNAEAVLQESTE